MAAALDGNAWVTLATQIIALLVGSIAALWAYTKYVLERGLLPPAQFDVEIGMIGGFADFTIMELILQLANRGSSTLVAHNIRIDIRYLADDDDVVLFANPADTKFGRLNFPHALAKEIGPRLPKNGENPRPQAVSAPDRLGAGGHSDKGVGQGRGVQLLRHDTFVQAGVNQKYVFITAVPRRCQYVLAWASFEYAQKPRRIQRQILRLSRFLGLIQYTLGHATVPHTVERVFRLPPEKESPWPENQPS